MPEEPRATEAPLLSVVIPAYEEEGVIGGTLERLRAVQDGNPKLAGRVEAIVVSDGSRDGTFAEALDGLRAGLRGRVVQLVANVGSHTAIRCGLRHATGTHIAVMASDGQDPPESLPEMIESFGPDTDIVWGRRAARPHDARTSRLLSHSYYRLFRRMTGLEYPPRGLDFFVMTRRVADAVIAHTQRNTSVYLLIFNLGFGQRFVDYERGERTAGTSGWTFRRRLKLGVDMLTSFSAAPIRLISLVGVAVGIVGILTGGITLLRAAFGDVPVPGWASLMVVTSIMSGLMLVAIGFLGEYVWRTLDEVRQRPAYLEGRREDITPP